MLVFLRVNKKSLEAQFLCDLKLKKHKKSKKKKLFTRF